MQNYNNDQQQYRLQRQPDGNGLHPPEKTNSFPVKGQSTLLGAPFPRLQGAYGWCINNLPIQRAPARFLWLYFN